jgi:DNA-binding NarL/FixJ family response regulator
LPVFPAESVICDRSRHAPAAPEFCAAAKRLAAIRRTLQGQQERLAMRALVCDQEAGMLETVARSFAVDTATSKATCIDLMRANPFDVLVASEQLADGSGLELLSHVATRWPDTLRVLAIEPARLRLLRGRLAPFGLYATIKYPIDEDELEAVLGGAHELSGDMADERPAEAARTTRSGARYAHKSHVSQVVEKDSSSSTRMRSMPPATPAAQTPPPHRRFGRYTPLGSPDHEQLRIISRKFDETLAPLAARAIRTREEARRPRTPTEKLGVLTGHLRDSLKRLLKR